MYQYYNKIIVDMRVFKQVLRVYQVSCTKNKNFFKFLVEKLLTLSGSLWSSGKGKRLGCQHISGSKHLPCETKSHVIWTCYMDTCPCGSFEYPEKWSIYGLHLPLGISLEPFIGLGSSHINKKNCQCSLSSFT